MHPTALEFCQQAILAGEVRNARVLDVGSFDVNGSARPIIEGLGCAEYVGIDFRMGPRVDIQLDASQIIPHFKSESFDVVVSTEMLEHCQDWRRAIDNMKAVLKPGGYIYITCRGPGFTYHPEETAEGAYGDYWRFTVEDFAKIFADFETLDLRRDPTPGVLYKGRKPRNTVNPVDLQTIEVARIDH